MLKFILGKIKIIIFNHQLKKQHYENSIKRK
mgnify:CR=1 FL=1